MVTVAVGNEHTHASAGTSCTSSTGSDGRPTNQCTDVSYPLPTKGYVTLKPKRRVRMVFQGHVSSVIIVLRAKAVPEGQSVYAATAGRDSRNSHRFKLLLPARLPCARILDILARAPGGNTDYWTAIRTPGCRRARG